MTTLVVREYGHGAELVIVLHGGPAAAGDVGPLARQLGDRWRALEPFQRPSGGRRLTVATHVQDLDDLIGERGGGRRPVLVGHSWGAMLALAYGAARPDAAAGLALVGCGTFSPATRAVFEANVEARLTGDDRAAIERVRATHTDAGRRLAATAAIVTRAYSYDPDEDTTDVEAIDARAHDETWADMLRLQRDGVYPAAFAAIGVPVLMLHGADDPHPGRAIVEELRPHLPQLAYRELARCGHWPWRERQARRGFFDALEAWIAETFRASA